MNIVLVEERAGSGREYTFNKGVVRFGRDPNECDIAFDNAQYPMVSRKHAEIVYRDGLWYIVDQNSTYGTFHNGQRISQPMRIGQGSGIQFGTDGPLFRVIWLEEAPSAAPVQEKRPEPAAPRQAETPKAPVHSAMPVPAPVQAVPQAVKPPVQQQAASPGDAKLTSADGSRQPLPLGQASIWLGRDPSCAMVFDSSSATVSRRHAEISFRDGQYFVTDNKSFNGTLVNGQRISTPVPLFHGDSITLGLGGPTLKFDSPSRPAPAGAELAGQRSMPSLQLALDDRSAGGDSPKTMVLSKGVSSPRLSGQDPAVPQLLFSVSFGAKNDLRIGRGSNNDIVLDGLQISKNHAKISQSGGGYTVEDLGSTNGVFVNGSRISRLAVSPQDPIQIGTFSIRIEPAGIVNVYDTRAKTRLDAIELVRTVKDRSGRGRINLVDGVSLSIQPNEFVGILGPSGAGKSTLMEVMNGMRPPTSGTVMLNGLDLYRHIDSLKSSIGFVPQEDIIHRELSVYRTLYFIAKLRLSRDVTAKEIDQIVNEVLDVTGLSERRNVPVDQLSGGQRKRVSMAVELLTKPSVIFLDEPTSGLDPVTEATIMRLFRQISESGRTVIMTTHAMENVRLFDKIIILIRGKLAFYGAPDEALKYFNAPGFKDLFERLEGSATKAADPSQDPKHQLTEQAALEWKQKYLATPEYKKYVQQPLAEVGHTAAGRAGKKSRLGIFGSISQWFTLTRRYFEVLIKDKLNLFILFSQAPAIALLTFIVMGSALPRDFVYFVLALVSFWFGTSVAAREIVRERPIYIRERMVNLGIFPYLTSKLFVLGSIVGLQCLMLFVPLKLLDLVGLMRMPGDLLGIPQFCAMLITAAAGIALGLFVSALVRTSEMATSLVPLILIPQILFSGIVGVPGTVSRVVSMVMPAAYSFDTMKRFSTLDTLEPEGADPRGRTKGLGLYRSIEEENDAAFQNFKNELEQYKNDARAFQADPLNNPTPLEPEMPEVKKVPDDLSSYVTFLHPWMNEVVDQLVLMLMFGLLVLATLIVLKLRDVA